MDLILENVRCFTGRHELDIRPLTLLVGENSTGKSTVLSMLSVLGQKGQFPYKPDFNQTPYELGNYPTIASAKSAKVRAEQFSIGGRGKLGNIVATYANKSGQPVLVSLALDSQSGCVTLDFVSKNMSVKSTDKNEAFNTLFVDERDFLAGGVRGEKYVFASVLDKIIITYLDEQTRKSWSQEKIFKAVDMITSGIYDIVKPVRSLAAVRTKPRRTYDALTEDFKPEGDHIPLLLARLLRETEHPRRAALLSSLEAFGSESGLFNKIDVRHLGNQDGDPFQVQAKLGKLSMNLIDVGYGVSQSLPVIVESVLTAKSQRLLLQQPEVHLHPRAQAALGTFFSGLVSAGKEFVIETHSDYLIDRIRQEVAKGTLSHDKVMILFFERTTPNAADVKVHPISLDKQGNVVGAPPSYRQFFVDEEMNLLTRGT